MKRNSSWHYHMRRIQLYLLLSDKPKEGIEMLITCRVWKQVRYAPPFMDFERLEVSGVLEDFLNTSLLSHVVNGREDEGWFIVMITWLFFLDPLAGVWTCTRLCIRCNCPKYKLFAKEESIMLHCDLKFSDYFSRHWRKLRNISTFYNRIK